VICDLGEEGGGYKKRKTKNVRGKGEEGVFRGFARSLVENNEEQNPFYPQRCAASAASTLYMGIFVHFLRN
jgi:hypothetical protein